MTDWLLVSGDFTPYGGMDRANYGLASYLARQNGSEVHLVAHEVAPALAVMPAVHVHRVPRPFGAHSIGEPFLRAAASRWHERLSSRGVRVIANGGNVDAGDATWVHYVHASFDPPAAGLINRLRATSNHRRYVREEKAVLTHARVVICNSRRTADDVVKLGVERQRTAVVYYGIDPERFNRIDGPARAAARRALRVPDGRRVALFVGALGDRRKGFDTLFDAWRMLCRSLEWDIDLLVAGAGAELPAWKARAARELPEGRMRFLGFQTEMNSLMAASDVLIHPARYEAYGLAVHEALCRGVPAIVSAHAGVAERYPEDLRTLLLPEPESASELVARLRGWHGDRAIADRVGELGACLRARTWDHMAREIVQVVERGAA